MRSALLPCWFGFVSLVSSACTTSLEFNTVDDTARSDQHQMPRREVADQGSGEATSNSSSTTHTLERVTAGGTYLRRREVASPGYQMNAGVHDVASQ